MAVGTANRRQKQFHPRPIAKDTAKGPAVSTNEHKPKSANANRDTLRHSASLEVERLVLSRRRNMLANKELRRRVASDRKKGSLKRCIGPLQRRG
jgi:hypothetical protein